MDKNGRYGAYDVIAAFAELSEIDWSKSRFGIEEGDIVYIYVGAPYSRIMFKTICTNQMVDKNDIIDDTKFWITEDQFDIDNQYVRLKLISNYDTDELSLNRLNKLGFIKKRIQGAYKSINYPELFSYIDRIKLNIDYVNEAYTVPSISETEKEILAKARIGQGIYRDNLLNKHESRCMLCGLQYKGLLIASHIKEWSEANNEERVDCNNGLLLCTLHDSLFDKHLITFDDNGKIMISTRLNTKDRALCNITEESKIEMESRIAKYMAYHRNKFLEDKISKNKV
ncbi:MAG: HNH endonuclease [Clostridiales bacterium]|nr:HNH endonuclease [Clostridiales bacterium]